MSFQYVRVKDRPEDLDKEVIFLRVVMWDDKDAWSASLHDNSSLDSNWPKFQVPVSIQAI